MSADSDAKDPKFTHLDEYGHARMVDVGAKQVTQRVAIASGCVRMSPTTLAAIIDGKIAKGDVLAVARVAGIQAAKETARWIPLCHPLPIDSIVVDFDASGEETLIISAEARISARTGVEMEALTAVSAAALTVYDMCKAADRGMVIDAIQLEEKRGGRSGTWHRQSSQE